MHPDYAEFAPRTGVVEWIGISTGNRAPIDVITEVAVDHDGIVGNYHSKRKISLIQMEHLHVIASFLNGVEVEPQQLRRNLLISGINLLGLLGQPFRIGEVHLIGTEPCPPCRRMEENLGNGGYIAMIGHGGITADVQRPGRIRLGDVVEAVDT